MLLGSDEGCDRPAGQAGTEGGSKGVCGARTKGWWWMRPSCRVLEDGRGMAHHKVRTVLLETVVPMGITALSCATEQVCLSSAARRRAVLKAPR